METKNLVALFIATALGVSSVVRAEATTTPSSKSRHNASHVQYRARIAYAPAGLVLPVTLTGGLSTAVAQTGDPVHASLSRSIQLQGATIPAGSTLVGQVTNAEASRHMGHSGHLGLKFYRLRTPDGHSYPITAHLIGGLEKYHPMGEAGSDQFRGDNGGTKLKALGVRTGVGLGAGALLGTAIGGIAGGGRGAGRGAWSGAAIGAGLGAADSLLLRKGREINLKSGSSLQLQLDQPVSIAASRAYL
ncbi:MAG TPA: hypothetical protein V6C97_20265 [Oculatellaceae cyanobacterium]